MLLLLYVLVAGAVPQTRTCVSVGVYVCVYDTVHTTTSRSVCCRALCNITRNIMGTRSTGVERQMRARVMRNMTNNLRCASVRDGLATADRKHTNEVCDRDCGEHTARN